MALTCSVAAAVFDRFPDYLRGVVVAHGVRNGPSSPQLVELLRQAAARLTASVESLRERHHGLAAAAASVPDTKPVPNRFESYKWSATAFTSEIVLDRRLLAA